MILRTVILFYLLSSSYLKNMLTSDHWSWTCVPMVSPFFSFMGSEKGMGKGLEVKCRNENIWNFSFCFYGY